LTGADIDEATLESVVNDEVATEEFTQSETPIALDGPSVMVDVPTSGLVAIFARVEMQAFRSDGGPACADIFLRITSAGGTPTEQLMLTGCGSYQRKWTLPGQPSAGTTNPMQGGWILLEAPPGPTTIDLTFR
jgi:hypothetical protein